MSRFSWMGRWLTGRRGDVRPQALTLKDPAFLEQIAQALNGSAGSNALCNSAVNRCVSLIANGIGTMPLHLFRGGGNAEYFEKATSHPLYPVLKDISAPHLTAYRFRRLMQTWVMNHGNAYAMPIRRGGTIIELQPIPPARVRTEQQDDWSVIHLVRSKSGEEVRMDSGSLLHIMGPSENGVTGIAVTRYARDAIGAARKLDTSVLAMLANGAQPGGILQTDRVLSDEAVARLRADFNNNYAGPENAGKWVVAEDGLKPVPFEAKASDQQAVELRSQQVEEVARFFGVPRPLLMLDDTSWGSGIEQLGLFFITYALLPWMVEWEQAISLYLLTPAERREYYPKLNEKALLRGSMSDQAEFLAKLMGAGGIEPVIARNEARRALEYPPVPGGDLPGKRLGE